MAFVAAGCRMHPVTLATMVIGDAANDADIHKRQDKLLGMPVSAADEMFGPRVESWSDTERENVELIVYPVKGDLLGSLRYAVEATNGKIVTLAKTKQNIDGMEDVIKAADLKNKLIGKTPAQCSQKGKLGRPLRTLRGQQNGLLARIYDVRNWTNLRGARYCVLRFDARDRCENIRLVGVSASTRKDPAKR